MSALEPRRRARRAIRPPSQRRQLEAALEAALSVVEAAMVLLDAMDGDAERETACEDEGAACEDEGSDTDREDEDAGTPERAWSIKGRPVHTISTTALRARRDCHDGNTLDPDDAPDPLQPPRYGYGCAR